MWPGDDSNHEVTFALRLADLKLEVMAVSTDRRKPAAEAWKARFGREWLTGTIDYLDGNWVDDLKTGRWVGPPRTSGQLASYALLPWLLNGRRGGMRVSFTQWEKYPLRAPPRRSAARLSDLDLAVHLDDLRWAAESDEVAPNEHCTFCPCRVQEGPWRWTSPWKYNVSCWSGLVQLTKKIDERNE